MGEWKQLYSGWISNPIGTGFYESRSFFEQRAAHGDSSLIDRLREHIRVELAAHEHFVLLLANDCLENLPPLTFFEGLVVDDGGVETDQLDLRRSTLFPVNDVGRVVGLACGELDKVTTSERFLRAEQMFPERKELFAEAVNALNVALYHRARAGLQRGDDGAIIHPAALSKYDQQLLKSAFRTTLELLQFTSQTYAFDASLSP